MTLRWLLLPLGLCAVLFGTYLCSRFRRGRYGDLRDFEVVVFGIPSIGLGAVALIGFFLFPANWSWNAPWPSVLVAALQVGVVLAKMTFCCWFFIQIRWTLPRFRYDQLMRLGWRVMLPLALVNLTCTALWVGLQ
ncbi:MAG: NADH-quinone oxidoreductase subunit H [Deltaproteobacteria bacterium]|nr:NADH-quinone oxidoreductase subunit H [Deltaproteobacteria bacterium]